MGRRTNPSWRLMRMSRSRLDIWDGDMDPSSSSPCTCGRDVISAWSEREEDFMSERVCLHLFYKHGPGDVCHFVRRF